MKIIGYLFEDTLSVFSVLWLLLVILAFESGFITVTSSIYIVKVIFEIIIFVLLVFLGASFEEEIRKRTLK